MRQQWRLYNTSVNEMKTMINQQRGEGLESCNPVCLKRCRDRVTLDPSLFTSFLLIYHPTSGFISLVSLRAHAMNIRACAIKTTGPRAAKRSEISA